LAGFLHAGELPVIEFVLIDVSPIVSRRVHAHLRPNVQLSPELVP
jgi:hypothetical protein